MSFDFYRAHLPETIRCLGFELKPLSLGHVILLNRIGSPFVDSDGDPTISDLASAVFICFQSYSEAISGLSDPALPKFMKRWHDKLSRADGWLVRIGLRRPTLVDFGKECENFIRYLILHSTIPSYSTKEGDFRTMHCPSVDLVRISMMRELNIPEAELMDRSWQRCLIDHLILKAMDGQIRFVDNEEIADAQQRANRIAEMVASGKIKVPR